MKRKINIGFIAPYNAMEPVIKELGSGIPDLEVTVRTGNLEAGVALALEMEKGGADILISRGGTAEMIRDTVNLPVVDIHISGYDLLRSIMLASSHPEDKIALVGFPNITPGASSIASLLDIALEVVTIHKAEEVEGALLALQQKRFTRILGDVVTVEVSAQLGMNGMLIHSGRESILESFDEARRLHRSLGKSQQLLRITQALFAKQKGDFLVADEEGQMLFENWASFDSMPLTPDEMKSLHSQALRNGSPLLKIVKNGSGAFSVQAERLEDRDGKIVSFIVDPIGKGLQQKPTINIEQVSHIPPLIAESPAMKKIKQIIEAPACAGCPISLVGGAGTGKKTVARYIHAYHQKKGLFVEAGMEDAKNAREELFSLPISTLFIKMDSPANETVLRNLGELAKTAAANDIQLITASDTRITEIEEAEGFENAVVLQLPGLNSRLEDIEAISRQFLMEFHQTLGTQPVKIRQDAMEEIIRSPAGKTLASLKSYIKGLALMEKGFVIERSTLHQLPFAMDAEAQEGILQFSASDTLKDIERKLIEQILQEEDFNQTKAAKRLGINRATLWRKLKD